GSLESSPPPPPHADTPTNAAMATTIAVLLIRIRVRLPVGAVEPQPLRWDVKTRIRTVWPHAGNGSATLPPTTVGRGKFSAEPRKVSGETWQMLHGDVSSTV